MTTNIQLQDYCKKLRVPLIAIRNKDDLPQLNERKDGLYIINSENLQGPNGGIHWVGLYIEGNQACFMDSFAGFPYRQIKEFSPKNLIFNKKQIQHLESQRCGEFVVWFGYCMCKKYKNQKGLQNRLLLFLKEFDHQNLRKNDEILVKKFSLYNVKI